MCLEALLELAPGGPFMDLGCGSGVLSIAAAKLGWSPVAGVDHERESVAATSENAAVNGVAVQARRVDLLRSGPVPSAPTVVANLVRPLLEAVAAAGFDGEPPRTLVVSGLLHDEADGIAEAFGRFGLRERARRFSGEWAALTLVR
jgi:ribosomal protein L11 methyltransferase